MLAESQRRLFTPPSSAESADATCHGSGGAQTDRGALVVGGVVMEPPLFVKFVRSDADLTKINEWRKSQLGFRSENARGSVGEFNDTCRTFVKLPRKVAIKLSAGNRDKLVPAKENGPLEKEQEKIEIRA